VTSLSANQLTCKPPESQPAALINGKEDYDELPDVVVLIGDSLQYKIGKLSYSTGKLLVKEKPPNNWTLGQPTIFVSSPFFVRVYPVILIAKRPEEHLLMSQFHKVLLSGHLTRCPEKK